MTKSLPNDHPMKKALSVALKVLETKSSNFPETAKPFIDEKLVTNLIEIASQNRFDDSPLVMKQKIRKALKARIRAEK